LGKRRDTGKQAERASYSIDQERHNTSTLRQKKDEG
jgi:hypothetical protein